MSKLEEDIVSLTGGIIFFDFMDEAKAKAVRTYLEALNHNLVNRFTQELSRLLVRIEHVNFEERHNIQVFEADRKVAAEIKAIREEYLGEKE